jgi:ATP-binding cassette subfamily B protein
MPLIEDLPESLASIKARAEVAVASDLAQDGAFGREWLVVADGAIAVWSGDGARERERIELASVDRVEDEALSDGGALVAEARGARLELVRYTAAAKPVFARVAAYLAQVIARRKAGTGEEPSIHADPDLAQRCPRCRLPLPQGSTICNLCAPKLQSLKRVLRTLRGQGGLAALAVALMLIGIGLGLVGPYLQRPYIDQVMNPAATAPVGVRLHLLIAVSALMLLASAIGKGADTLRSVVLLVLGRRISHRLRLELFDHISLMSLRFFDRAKSGQLLARITRDTEALQSVIVDGVQHFLVNVLTLLAIGAIMLWMNWRLTMLVLLPVPVVLLLARLGWPFMIMLYHRFYHLRGDLLASVTESINGVRVVKAFAREKAETARFEGRSVELWRADLRADLVWATIFPIFAYLVSTGSLLVTWLGGASVVHGTLSAGTLLAFTLYLGMFYGPLQWLSRLTDHLMRAITSSARIFEVLDTVPDIPPRADAQRLTDLKGAIAFEQVVFGYDKHKPALKGVSFAIAPGEMVGLVGHSGAGKSTVINLLCRFYDVDGGRIAIDGVDLRRLDGSDIRRNIGVVLQDTFLFNGTIAENIAYARPEASLSDIIAAAKAANAHDFIVGKPDGYDTVLGERGVTISGGERQRLSIARAILHDPRILILDEATASVDTDTEAKIQEAIARLVKGRTTIAIAHRLSTLRNADRLLVLKGGEVIEQGTHEELLAKEGGEFRRLVDAQQAMSKIVEVA